MMRKNTFFITVLFLLCCFTTIAQQATDYEKEIESWKQKRINDLKAANGWLNLAGLFWLQEGKNTFGTGKEADLRFPGKLLPPQAGYFELTNGMVTLSVNEKATVQVNNQAVKQALLFHPDSAYNPYATAGSLTWNVIKRGDKTGIRLRDMNSKLARTFSGCERFPTDSAWKIAARLQKPDSGASTIAVMNVLGQLNRQETAGKLFFSFEGKEYSLDALTEGDELFILFGDATNSKSTYPAGRFLYAAMPGANGITFIDFNKAYNPPCAFTPYATCPLPPKQNVLPFAVQAGEKKYH